MFDGLMGSKFSAKCKQAVKNTVERVLAICKKKQAMINLLKKDVADLIAQGHDNHAFSRMDKIVSDANHIRCYDLIADFCECIAAHLPVMHKLKRECPPECVEAVATLIFAAARFSDLPELCILRSLFTERYGGAMESSVNTEFIEKVSKHTLSKNAKLKLMQDIALEHSVDWNSNNFGQTNTPAPASVQPKQHVPGNDRKEHKPVDGVKHAATTNNVAEQNASPRQRPEAYLQGGDAVPKGQGGQPKQDLSITNRNEHKLVDGMKHEATSKNVEEQIVLARGRAGPDVGFGGNAVSKDRDLQSVAKDIHIVAGSKSCFYPDAKMVRAEVKDVHSSSTPQNYRKESGVEEGWSDAQLGNGSKNNTGGVATRKVEKVNPTSGLRRASNMAPPYVKARDKAEAPGSGLVDAVRVQVGLVNADGVNKATGGTETEEVEAVKPANGCRSPYVKPGHMHGGSWDHAAAPQQGLDSVTMEKKIPVGLVKEDGSNRALKERGTSKKEPNGATSPKPPTPALFRPPPYLKPSNNDNAGGNPMDYQKVADGTTTQDAGARLQARSASEVENHLVPEEHLVTTADKTAKPKSVRRNTRKPPSVVTEDAGRIPPGKHQRTDRRGPYHPEEEVDEEEKIDWLLMHYSRKGMPDRKQQIKRVASLPHEDSPKAVSVPARAASLLTDEPSPNGRPVRHQLPDYEELAARFNALKRS